MVMMGMPLYSASYMEIHMKKQLGLMVVLVLSMLLSNGCLFGGHSKVKREGTKVGEETIKQIEPGKTDLGWVRAVLGEPSEKIKISDNESIWKYSYKETKDSSGYVFVIFGGSSESISENRFFVQFKDNIVVRSWRD
jgi:outer membrane protein assembly factor BamE (lipoprotein component of BamABCDE complex)